jgi:hypothetical protein
LKRPYYRVLKSELDRFEDVDEIFLFKFDDMRQTWSGIHAIDLGTSPFVGLNYPFHGTWSGTELSSIYVANMMDYDVANSPRRVKQMWQSRGTTIRSRVDVSVQHNQ